MTADSPCSLRYRRRSAKRKRGSAQPQEIDRRYSHSFTLFFSQLLRPPRELHGGYSPTRNSPHDRRIPRVAPRSSLPVFLPTRAWSTSPDLPPRIGKESCLDRCA